MISRFDRHSDRNAGRNRALYESLSTPIHAPDLTRSIMGRLGYMRVPDKVAQKKRRNRILRRSVYAAAMVAALGAGFSIYQQSESVRQPADVTVPGAIIQEAQQSRMRLNEVLNSIRLPDTERLQVPASQPQPTTTPRYNEQMEPTDPTRDEDVNRSAVAPFRWV